MLALERFLGSEGPKRNVISMNRTLAWLPQTIIPEVSFETGGYASSRVGLERPA